jgi:hypothetical protein
MDKHRAEQTAREADAAAKETGEGYFSYYYRLGGEDKFGIISDSHYRNGCWPMIAEEEVFYNTTDGYY